MDQFLPTLVRPNHCGRAYQPVLPMHWLSVSDRGSCPTSFEFGEQMMDRSAPSIQCRRYSHTVLVSLRRSHRSLGQTHHETSHMLRLPKNDPNHHPETSTPRILPSINRPHAHVPSLPRSAGHNNPLHRTRKGINVERQIIKVIKILRREPAGNVQCQLRLISHRIQFAGEPAYMSDILVPFEPDLSSLCISFNKLFFSWKINVMMVDSAHTVNMPTDSPSYA